MRVGIIGRTHLLLDAAKLLHEAGVELAFIYTCRSEEFYSAKERDFEDFANRIGARFFNDLKIESRVEELRALGADVCISMNWLSILPKKILDLFPMGVLNAHPGDLPRYKGNACPNWALLNFESQICLTIHQMSIELDSGPILMRQVLPVDESTYIGEVYDWLGTAVPAAFLKAVNGLASGTLAFHPQSPQIKPLRVYPRRPEDSRIRWSESARNVLALVRASSRPFDGATTTFEGREEISIYRASQYYPDFDFLAVPGQVCLAVGENPVVAAGDGMIEIQECASAFGSDRETKRRILSSLRNRLK